MIKFRKKKKKEDVHLSLSMFVICSQQLVLSYHTRTADGHIKLNNKHGYVSKAGAAKNKQQSHGEAVVLNHLLLIVS